MKSLFNRTILWLMPILFLCETGFAFDHSHQKFDRLLKENVVLNGLKSSVTYGKIKSDPKLLDDYVAEIEAVTATKYKEWSKDRQMAFLINAYNALTIKLILTKYPDISSIKDLGGLFSSPWKKKFFILFGKKSHLDEIEHGILRKTFQEPRIHFALVCASKGCPALQNEAFVADRLNEQLDKAMKQFFKDPDRNRYHKDTRTLEISSIFKWFSGDFEKSSGSIEAFVAPWITDDLDSQLLIRQKKVDIEFLDYDWSLNKAE